MKQKKLVFNLADRDKHMDALKQLYGDSDAKEAEDRQEADIRPKDPDPDPK